MVALLLAKGADVQRVKDEDLLLSLSQGKHKNNGAILRLLVDARVDVNTRIGDGSCALSHAVDQGDIALVEALLDKGASVHVPAFAGARRGRALLMTAVAKGEPMVKALLDHGVDPNDASLKASEGTTLLILAPDVATVKLLVSRRADVNARDGNGYTALDYAETAGKKEIVAVLIAHGAKSNAARSASVRREILDRLWSR